MCMLFGLSSKRIFDLKRPLKEFFAQGVNHPDGWGLCLYNDKNTKPEVWKGMSSAHKSITLKKLIDSYLSGRTAIAHIRKKTYGEVSLSNCHPFILNVAGSDWVLAHNGSVRVPALRGPFYPQGETDSEKILCRIANDLHKANASTEDQIIKSIDGSIRSLAKCGKLNLLITNGKLMIVHTNCRNTLYYANHPADNHTVAFCTDCFLIPGLYWRNVPMNTVLAFKEGKLIYEGQKHTGYYTPAPRYFDDLDSLDWRKMQG